MNRILFVSNSQGAASGLPLDEIYHSYPHLVQKELPKLNCIFWNRSYLNVVEVNESFREIVINHKPDIVFLQCGIIESGLRIIPRRIRDVLRGIYGGGLITGYIHKHQVAWRKFLSKLNIYFTDFTSEEFECGLKGIIKQCAVNDIKIVILLTPLLSEQCNRNFLFNNNKIIEKYNDIIIEICNKEKIKFIIPDFDKYDKLRNSMFLMNSVHFTKLGHEILARQIVKYLTMENIS